MKKLLHIIATPRGGEYTKDETRSYDLQEQYLNLVFGFVGITEIAFINAQPMDAAGDQVQKHKTEEAQRMVRAMAEIF